MISSFCKKHVPLMYSFFCFAHRAGTDITTSDNNGRTPLQLAQAKLKLLQKSSSNTTEMSQVQYLPYLTCAGTGTVAS
jgi:hypothetical protein